eukprot:2194596-Amphidinium_carterae.1
MEVLPLVSSGHSPTAEAEEALVTFDVDGDKDSTCARSFRASSCQRYTHVDSSMPQDPLAEKELQDLCKQRRKLVDAAETGTFRPSFVVYH